VPLLSAGVTQSSISPLTSAAVGTYESAVAPEIAVSVLPETVYHWYVEPDSVAPVVSLKL